MKRYLYSLLILALVGLPTIHLEGAETAIPKAIPKTRPEMKQALDDLKRREPRLPLPAPTEEDKASNDQRRLVNNGRMRKLYLGDEFSTGGSGPREKDPAMTLDNAFTVEFFWIASRVNNCHYCLGHQENKLLAAGRTEDRIAALDTDWTSFTGAEKAAFTFARKLSYEPHLVTSADLDKLKPYYQPLQILEICYLVGGYNATNRWTDGMGIPQEDHRTFVTGTPEKFVKLPSLVAPAGALDRGALEPRSEVEARLTVIKQRKPVFPLVEEAEARKILDKTPAGETIPQWQRLLLNFPISGKGKIASLQAAREKGKLSAKLKAEIDWVSARQDRAWYDLAAARARLKKMGLTDDQIFALDGPREGLPAAEAAALTVAAKITAAPQSITDADLALLKRHFSASEVAEVVYYTTQTAFMHRVTEPAQLAAEE